MRGAGHLWLAVLGALLGASLVAPAGQSRDLGCAPTVRATLRLAGGVDGLLPLGQGGALLALARPAPPGGALPPDTLLLLREGQPRSGARIALPRYGTLPGLALGAGRWPRAYVVVDHALWVLDPVSGRVQARWPLDMQAVGWPAAVATAARDGVYVAGQPRDNTSWAAVVEALRTDGRARPRLVWRASLGLTHAGIWLSDTGTGRLAVYIPDGHDVSGVIALLDQRSGRQVGAYSVPVPPLGADVPRDLLYLDVGGMIRAVTLSSGRMVGTAVGSGPLAVAAGRGLVAFTRQGEIVLARAATLRAVGHLGLGGVTALAITPDGTLLLVGLRSGLAWVNLGSCRG